MTDERTMDMTDKHAQSCRCSLHVTCVFYFGEFTTLPVGSYLCWCIMIVRKCEINVKSPKCVRCRVSSAIKRNVGVFRAHGTCLLAANVVFPGGGGAKLSWI